MYRLNSELWPQRDPITGRELCHACWNHKHQDCGLMHDEFGHIRCDHYQLHVSRGGRIGHAGICDCKHECDYYHFSEADYAAEERARHLKNRREQRATMQAMLDDEANPLRAVNPDYRSPARGKRPGA